MDQDSPCTTAKGGGTTVLEIRKIIPHWEHGSEPDPICKELVTGYSLIH